MTPSVKDQTSAGRAFGRPPAEPSDAARAVAPTFTNAVFTASTPGLVGQSNLVLCQTTFAPLEPGYRSASLKEQ